MRNFLFITIVGLTFFSSCSCEDDVVPNNLADEITGAYTGVFTLRTAYKDNTDTIPEKLILITRHNEQPSLLMVTIDGFSRVVTLRNITKNDTEKFSGEVFVYTDPSKIGKPGEQIAGSGSFAYSSNKFTLLWIADPINDEWKFSFNGNRN